jgi:hypothetical protein
MEALRGEMGFLYAGDVIMRFDGDIISIYQAQEFVPGHLGIRVIPGTYAAGFVGGDLKIQDVTISVNKNCLLAEKREPSFATETLVVMDWLKQDAVLYSYFEYYKKLAIV